MRRKKKERKTITIDPQLYEHFKENEEEFEEYKEAFLFFDPFGKGFITKKNLNMIFYTTGKMINESDRDLIFRDVGIIGSKLSFNQFLACMLHNTVRQPDDIQDIRDSFMALRNEKDEITVKKFKHVMTNLLNKLSNEEVDNVINQLKTETKLETVRTETGEIEREVEVISNLDELFELMVTKKY